MSSQHNTSSQKSSQQNTLSLLPFNKITNIELYNTLETIESYIKECLRDTKFTNHIQATLPDSSFLKKPCKYYTTDQYCTLNTKTMGTHIKLLHMNIRTLDGHYGELLALNIMIGECFDFITLTEIWPYNLDSRAALIARDIGFNFECDPPQKVELD